MFLLRRMAFHLVDSSPWPFFMSLWIFIFFLFSFLFMQKIVFKSFFLLILMTLVLFTWWRDVVRESSYLSFHTKMVKKNIYISMIFFIVSEVFFFFGFFWTFFHSSMSVVVDLYKMWPPVSINTFNPMSIPLLNTIILLSSSMTVTWSHYSLFNKFYKDSVLGLLYTVFLSLFFTSLQLLEYNDCSYSFNDSIFSSIFFLSTSFHSFHVLLGTLMLIVCFFRLFLSHFNPSNQVGFECSIWYWHFVDVVWIFLYVVFYWWSSL